MCVLSQFYFGIYFFTLRLFLYVMFFNFIYCWLPLGVGEWIEFDSDNKLGVISASDCSPVVDQVQFPALPKKREEACHKLVHGLNKYLLSFCQDQVQFLVLGIQQGGIVTGITLSS